MSPYLFVTRSTGLLKMKQKYKLDNWLEFMAGMKKRVEKQKERIANDPNFKRPLVDDSESVYDHCDTKGIAGYHTGSAD